MTTLTPDLSIERTFRRPLAPFGPPLMSNVRPHAIGFFIRHKGCFGALLMSNVRCHEQQD